MSVDWIERELEEIEKRGLSRSLRRAGSAQGALITLDGREVVNFSSNDYLGLASDPRLVRAAQVAAARYGAGAGSSRLIAGNLSIIAELEERLAAFTAAPAALVFSTGYHANLGVIAALAGKEDAVFSDRLNHASIIDGCRLSRAKIEIYNHADPLDLDRLLSASKARRNLVVTESLFSMDGDLAPLPELVRVANSHRAMIVIDEAHAFGVLGPTGRGGLEHFGLTPANVDAVIGTVGKAMGGFGAFVLGSSGLINFLVNRSRSFIFTTGPAPASAGAAMEAIRVMEEEPWRRERALASAAKLRDALAAKSPSAAKAAACIVPVVLGKNDAAMEISRELLARGLYVQGIRPPTVPPGSSRLRISLRADHNDLQIAHLIESLQELLP